VGKLLGTCAVCKRENTVSLAAERRGYWCDECLSRPVFRRFPIWETAWALHKEKNILMGEAIEIVFQEELAKHVRFLE
jgi:DNA-directed RNA polymerase subunit RPC12/RpoP